MSLPDPRKTEVTRLLHRIALSGLIASLVLVSACTVRPLYSSKPLLAGSQVSASAELGSISIKPVNTRYAQQVRNNLIFAFGQGAGEPASPVYSLDLGVTELVEIGRGGAGPDRRGRADGGYGDTDRSLQADQFEDRRDDRDRQALDTGII